LIPDAARGQPAGKGRPRETGSRGVKLPQVRVAVTIHGERHHLRGDGPPGRIEALAARVDARMSDLARGNPRLSTAQVAVLAALTLAEDLDRVEDQYQRAARLLARRERRQAELDGLPESPDPAADPGS
jgi:cell division protein ZapA